MPPHQQTGSRGKNEPLRHVNKTEEDRTPPHLRKRVLAAQARRDAMRGARHIPAFHEGSALYDADDENAPPIKETR